MIMSRTRTAVELAKNVAQHADYLEGSGLMVPKHMINDIRALARFVESEQQAASPAVKERDVQFDHTAELQRVLQRDEAGMFDHDTIWRID